MPTEVTILLDEIKAAKPDGRESLDRLLPLVYDELRRLAGSFLNRESEASIQTTELVHEAYFRLTRQHSVDWSNSGQFFAIAAQAMRRILIDAARARKTQKREAEKISLEDTPSIPAARDERILALDNALKDLAELDPEQARLVELRYFAGLSIDETAKVLEISASTVKREWVTARAWLYRRLRQN